MVVHEGDWEKQQDLPASLPPPRSLLSFILFHCFHWGKKQMKTRRAVRAVQWRKEKADLWGDYRICFRTKREGDMADGFWKIDYFAVRWQNSRKNKWLRDKHRRISEIMQRSDYWGLWIGSLQTLSHRWGQHTPVRFTLWTTGFLLPFCSF